MLKKTITYEDFDGNTRTEDFYFNLTKAELLELEVGAGEGGIREKLLAIVAANNGEEIIENFKKIILLAYGEKSADGKRFVKNQEIRESFAATEAYSELFFSLATDANVAAEFMRGIIPAKLLEEGAEQLTIPEDKPEESEAVLVIKPDAVPDLTKMSREELLHALAQQKDNTEQ